MSVGTTNFDRELDPKCDYHSRGFTTFITDPALIHQGITVFNDLLLGIQPKIESYKISDVQHGETRLSWGPWHHHQHILNLIKNAMSNIDIYQQDLQDKNIVAALASKAAEGIKVRILMSGYPFSQEHGNKNLANLRQLQEVNAQVLLTSEKKLGKFFDKPLHIHAKVLMCDAGTPSEAMYLGSANFYPDVLDPSKKNLNLGIITKDSKFIQPVNEFFSADWTDHENFPQASLEYWVNKINVKKIS